MSIQLLLIILGVLITGAVAFGILTRKKHIDTESHLSGGATLAKASSVITESKKEPAPKATAIRVGKIIEDNMHGETRIKSTVFLDDDRSKVVFGTTGSGKTATYILPTALTHPGILLSTSVKGEIAQKCLKARSALGKVVVIDPAEVLHSESLIDHRKIWTPLQSSRSYSEAVEVADLLIKSGASKEQSTWTESATSLLGVLLWTTAQFPGTSMLDLMRLLGSLRGAKESKTKFGTIDDEDEEVDLTDGVKKSSEFGNMDQLIAFCADHDEGGWIALEEWLLWATENGINNRRKSTRQSPAELRKNKTDGLRAIHPVKLDAQGALSDFGALAAVAAAKETAAGVIFSLNGSLRQIKSAWAVASTSWDDPTKLVDLDRWASSQADSIFVVAPDASEPLRGYFSAFLAMCVRALDRKAMSNKDEQLDEQALMLLDELANICPVPHLSNWLSTKRSQRISFFIALQSFSQLEARYGKEEAAVIVDNCAALQILLPGSTDQATLDHFANKTGEYLHEQNQTSVAKSAGESWETGLQSRTSRSKNKGTSITESVQTSWRPLAQPAALRSLEKTDAVAFISGRVANEFMRIRMMPWYEDQELQQLVNPKALIPAHSKSTDALSEWDF